MTEESPLAPSDPGEILVVDDDRANLLAIEAALGDLGPRLVMVRSGGDALRHLLQNEVALILLDVHMPGMDGFETARLIRARAKNRHVPIIFVTAYDQSDARVLEGYTLGAVDFLFKPVVSQMLRSKASVFVELSRRAYEVARQAEQLRQHERREALSRLETERQKWEQEALRRQMEEQRRTAETMRKKAIELARTVAEREAAQAELERINARLEESDHRKDEFLATLAHELRNPLAPMSYALGILQGEEDDQLQSMHARLTRQLAHLERLVDDLLDVSRVTSGKIELHRSVIDLRDPVRQAVDMSESAMTACGHTLEVELSDDPLPVHADGVRMAQVVSNLLNNAARYTDPGGHVNVRAYASQGQAVVAVTDDGRGIRRRHLETIFEAFVQENAGGGGLGLGLHLVQRLVRLHGGAVRAHSAGPGKGSRFEIRVPTTDAAELPDPPTRTSVRPVPAVALRVAVIEDQEDIREMASLLLQRWGHEVLPAECGEDGIALTCEQSPDVVIVDIGLPDMDGYAVAERLREKLGDGCPPLVAVTGWGQAKDRQRALESGFTRHLVKPVSARDLRRVLDELAQTDVPTAARELKATLDEYAERAAPGEVVHADRREDLP